MAIIAYIIGLVLGFFIFGFLNRIFDIYYFGFKGLVTTFLGCWTAGTIIVVLFGYLAKYLIIIFAVLWLLAKIFKHGGGDKQSDSKPQ